jgi:trimeric autotransporter adhesin
MPLVPANVSTGKSFINISRPGGGTVVPGDELEIRVSVNVSNAGTNLIYRSRFNDTIPANLTYVPGSLRLLTNEGKQYAAYTDAAGDDAAMYNSSNKTIRFNLGRDTAAMVRGVVNDTGIDSISGGYTRSSSHAPRGNGMLVIVTYRVTVDASTPYNTIINYGSGAMRYRNQFPSMGAVDYTLTPNSLSFIIYPNYGLCSNATGANNVSAGNGDFGSGTSHNGPNPGAAVPGYTYLSITTGAPNDGMYSVVKNLSPSQSTDPFIPRPEDPNTHRVFRVWDIIGDHTGAADPFAGNPPSPSGANGGYMLAVNAAYQLSIANNQTITGLCENTYYEFSAWFRNVCKRCGSDSLGRGASNLTVSSAYIPTAPGDSSGVKPNLTFMINGVDYYTSGDMDYIGNYGQWVKKGFVFLTSPGQTSLTISIKNNAPGGGGNDWVMDDISFATCLPSLTMRPTNSPTYCRNNQVDISVAVSTFFDNYNYYQWERSTDGGTTWISAPEMPGQQAFNFTNYSGEYRDTAALPSFVAGASYDGYKYRIRVGTTTTNLTSGVCALYNDVDIITINVSPSCDVLPVEIIQFNVQLKNDYAQLFWKAKQENNLATYIIERSTDAVNFTSIGTLPVKGAQAIEELYLFNDMKPVYGKVYYRLRLSAVTGGTKFSNVLSVQPGQTKFFEVSNIVNPLVSKILFQVSIVEKEQIDVQLMDAAGRFILAKKIMINKGTNAVEVDVPANLQPGSYILRIISKHGTVSKPIQK